MAAKEEVDVASNSITSKDSGDDAPPTSKTSRFLSYLKKSYSIFGFTKMYNIPLFVIFAGAMFAFSLSRLMEYDYDGIFTYQLIPGYMYFVHAGYFRVGMIMHLAGCLPAGLLMGLQFIPKLRHKFLLFHRINGYLVIALYLVSNVGACIALGHADSGARVSTSAVETLLVILTTIGLSMAYINVKRLQIDQHRAWMIRSMFYFGTIITSRLSDLAAMSIITRIGGFYAIWTCNQIDYMGNLYGQTDILATKYPQCLVPNGTVDGRTLVKADFTASSPEGWSAAGDIVFGTSLWLSVLIHLVGVEIYLNLTPREAARLRQVSYEKQLKAGYKNPGFGGWTVDRFGDAEKWQPSAS